MDFSLRRLLKIKISGQSYNSVDAPKSALLKAWDVDYLHRIVDSVNVCLKACVEAKAFNFEHSRPQIIL